jgi:hypothetical protein
MGNNNSDIHSNSFDGSNDWQIGNEYRRSEWLAQLRILDGSTQALRYDSNRDEWRVWAHAPFYPTWTCPFSLRYSSFPHLPFLSYFILSRSQSFIVCKIDWVI